jgi:Cys-tRNA(Pro)/Cys-tRNA(Cys) deacylase
MRLLSAAGIAYTVREYPEELAEQSAVHVAEFLSLPAEQVFKTLVLRLASGDCIVCCIPSGAELDLKKTARAAGEKSASLVPVKELFALTGYVRGGCSPVGMKKPFPVLIDETAGLFDSLAVNGGERGVLVLLNPEDLARVTGAVFVDIT